jgi:predicted trehalose synthase
MTKSDRDALERELPEYLMARRWFRGKARRIASVTVEEAFSVLDGDVGGSVALVRARYADGGAEDYVVTLTEGWRAGDGPMREATIDAAFSRSLLAAFGHDRKFKGWKGDVVFSADRGCQAELASASASLEPSVLSAEQSNTSIAYGQRCILKLYRCVEPGVNPELEVGRFLTAKGFAHVPPVLGHVEYRPRGGEATVLGILQGFIPHRGDGWRHARAAVNQSGRSGFIHTASINSPVELAEDIFWIMSVDRESNSDRPQNPRPSASRRQL